MKIKRSGDMRQSRRGEEAKQNRRQKGKWVEWDLGLEKGWIHPPRTCPDRHSF